MLVFKFGGASVNSSKGVKNLAEIVSGYSHEKIIVVVSAMGKITNALELLTDAYFKTWNESFEMLSMDELIGNEYHVDNNSLILPPSSTLIQFFQNIYNYHITICNELFQTKDNQVYIKLKKRFFVLLEILKSEPSLNYDFIYDQIVSNGELFSTIIISEYLNSVELKNKWIDARKCIRTDHNYREPKVGWDETGNQIKKSFTFAENNLYITQGFIGSTEENNSTTLGREGSDYTAALLAYFIDASKVMIWKDVEGVYNADPKIFSNPQKIPFLSYKEAIELTYYGASVIHPKTIKPLQNKNIPLYVRSFLIPSAEGTVIADSSDSVIAQNNEKIPVYIIKNNQVMINFSPRDFSFIAEENLSIIFSKLNKFRIRANLSQNSATSFSICVDFRKHQMEQFVNELMAEFDIQIRENLELVTVQNYQDDAIQLAVSGRKIYIRQFSESTARFVVETI